MNVHLTEKVHIGDTLPPDADGHAGEWFFDTTSGTYYWHDGTQWNPIIQPPPIQYYETYDDVRADTPIAPIVLVGGNNAVGDGGAGFFSKDNSFPLGDNDGTVLVDASGNKWVRVFGDTVSAKWFIPKGTTVVAGGVQANNLYDLVETYHGHRRIEWSDIDLEFGGTVNNANVFVRSRFRVPPGATMTCSSTSKARMESCTLDTTANPGSLMLSNFEVVGSTFLAPNTNDSNTRAFNLITCNVYNSRFDGPDNLTTHASSNNGYWIAYFRGGSRATNCYFNNITIRVYESSILSSSRQRVYVRQDNAGAWEETLSVNTGGIVESSVFDWDIKSWNRTGISVYGGRVQNSTFNINAQHAGAGGSPLPLNTVFTGFINNNSIVYKRTDTTGPATSFSGIFVNGYNPSNQRSVIGNYIYIENSNGNANGIHVIAGNTASPYLVRMLIASNTIENGGATPNGSGIILQYSVGSVHMQANNIVNFDVGIGKNSTITLPDITGHSNRFVNCNTNIVHPDYVNATDDRSW